MTRATSRPAAVAVGIGASAGGIEPLCTLLGGLQPDLAAAVLVVVHLHSTAPSVLDHILGRCCSLPVSFAVQGMQLDPGQVYVAPTDRHLRASPGVVVLDHGPTVHAVRPSVDVLFDSLAAAYGPKSIGVILSGTRDDGATGLRSIKQAGGLALVQDPAEAVFAGMPTNACRLADPDRVAVVARLAGFVTQAADRLAAGKGEEVAVTDPVVPHATSRGRRARTW